MEILAFSWADIWSWIEDGNDQLRKVAYYATILTFLGVMFNLFSHWYSWRPVKIVVVNGDSAEEPKESQEIGELPRRSVTRAEVVGFVSQRAGGETLNFKRFKFDYRFKNRVLVRLPADHYRLVTGEAAEAAAIAAA